MSIPVAIQIVGKCAFDSQPTTYTLSTHPRELIRVQNGAWATCNTCGERWVTDTTQWGLDTTDVDRLAAPKFRDLDFLGDDNE